MDQWMTNLADALTTLPLNQLAIPGSHDSGAYNLSNHLSPSAPSILSWIPGLDVLAQDLLKEMSTTQTLTIGKQLEAGIRHLDFRVSWWKEDFYFVHAIYGTRIAIALEEMKAFLDKHPKEIVILDLQHFYQFDAQSHTKFIALLKSTFGTKLCEEKDFKDLTLKYLWDNKKQIICIYQHDEASKEKDFWTPARIESPWPNKPSPDDVIKALTGYMDKAKDVKNKFFVCQGVVTPDTSNIISNVFTDKSLKDMTEKFNPVFNTWLTDSPNHWKHQPNIVIHDFIELGGYVQYVLALNKHRIPSSPSTS